ncbi:pentatricopeptide repeat-containing protein [Babesia caballi]|uniref:Pentatricopeptide repeat-containing protein n=1 Tax=Babesia caballi TaxID=5871 RepID=A0AAV4LT67_BABCB|nr:pentatricopeptide repeat-containing protein [Babesia caballi]
MQTANVSSARSQRAAAHDRDVHLRPVVGPRLQLLDGAQRLHALHHLAEDHVLAVEVRRGHEGDEELRVVGVGAAVGHAEQPALGVLVDERLVVELVAVDADAARAVAVGDVAALHHEALDEPVELVALVVDVRLFVAELLEVLDGLGHRVLEERDDQPAALLADGEVQVDPRHGGQVPDAALFFVERQVLEHVAVPLLRELVLLVQLSLRHLVERHRVRVLGLDFDHLRQVLQRLAERRGLDSGHRAAVQPLDVQRLQRERLRRVVLRGRVLLDLQVAVGQVQVALQLGHVGRLARRLVPLLPHGKVVQPVLVHGDGRPVLAAHELGVSQRLRVGRCLNLLVRRHVVQVPRFGPRVDEFDFKLRTVTQLRP